MQIDIAEKLGRIITDGQPYARWSLKQGFMIRNALKHAPVTLEDIANRTIGKDYDRQEIKHRIRCARIFKDGKKFFPVDAHEKRSDIQMHKPGRHITASSHL